jgi:hypothetical protein
VDGFRQPGARRDGLDVDRDLEKGKLALRRNSTA